MKNIVTTFAVKLILFSKFLVSTFWLKNRKDFRGTGMIKEIRWDKRNKLSKDVVKRLKEYLKIEPNPTTENRFYEVEYLNLSMAAPVKWLCYTLHVSRSGYYKWLHNRDNKIRRREKLLNEILIEIDASDGIAGIKRLTKQINAKRAKKGQKLCTEYQVRNLVRKYGLFSQRYGYKRSTIKYKCIKRFNNYLNRNYNECAKDEFWSIDITEMQLSTGRKVYMCAVIDVRTRYLLSYSIDVKQKSYLVTTAVMRALSRHSDKKPIFIHSDNGRQFYTKEFKKMLKENGIKQSASKPYTPGDNAVVEAFFSCLKCEKIYRIDKPDTIEELRHIVGRYVQYYNSYRILHRYDKTPAEMYYG